MNFEAIIGKHKLICENACGLKLFDALEDCRLLINDIPLDGLKMELAGIEETYANLLNYSIKGIDDPQRNMILNGLVVKIVELADRVKEFYVERNNAGLMHLKASAFNKLTLVQQKFKDATNSRLMHNDLADLLKESEIVMENVEVVQKHESFRRDLFEYVLYSDKLSDDDVAFVKEVFRQEDMAWYEKCLITTAVTLSMIRFFDTQKIDLLFGFYESGLHQVKQRALVGIVLLFYLYDDRINYYKALNDKVKKIYARNEISETDVLTIIKQFVKAKDTEKITRRMQDEIIPDIQKLTPRIEDKLDLMNLMNDESAFDKNPDWQSILEDSPELMDKLEELSKMQLDGNDVFMSAFSMLKQFAFFDHISNWFVPFYKENSETRSVLDSEEGKFKEVFSASLERSTYMCNSDKYSFMLNLRMMPEQQKSMLLSMFNAELESVNELADEDEILNSAIINQTVYTQYIQDLYRFYKLHTLRGDFSDIFEMKLDFYTKGFVRTIFRDETFLTKIADFYFKTDHYTEASDVFLQIESHGGKADMELLQKMGYCFQRAEKYEKALKYYHKAELFDSRQSWCLKKIAFCYNQLKNYGKALEYYLEVEKLEPTNRNILVNIANCYLNLKDFNKALHYFYKIEFNTNDISGICRPISWCLFVLGAFDKAEEYILKLMENANNYDFMNYGHLEFVKGNREKASELYLQSIHYKANSWELFLRGFVADTEYLLKFGVSEQEIQIMLDFVRYRI
ncbi:MAG: tetratricopeptide repeat protein [Bacteroidota bacterium]